MYQRKPTRRFRRRPNNRSGLSRANGGPTQMRPHSFSNGQARNKFRPTLSAERLFEKYNTLAKEAMTTGDKTLSENYFQHADHFARIIEDKNKNQNQSKPDLIQNPTKDNSSLSQNKDVNNDQPTNNNDQPTNNNNKE